MNAALQPLSRPTPALATRGRDTVAEGEAGVAAAMVLLPAGPPWPATHSTCSRCASSPLRAAWP